MGWSQLPTGAFTGIDWSRPGATDGFDPYLVWAETDQFAGYDGKPGKWLPGVIELHAGYTVAAFVALAPPRSVRVRKAYTSPAAPAGLRFCTAQVGREFFQEIRP